ncbi:acyltransferase family protein [uncultured Sphingomonas sp.]|uniref:acyltransferase family protein n=1 Tax=uncultured Sphingomonas sp. TaxID=158754 RepID=UPI0035CAAFB8
MGQARQPGLDVVRGTAILLVLLFHGGLPLGVPALDAVFRPLFAVGWIGVDLFFVLSGFLVGRMILVETASSGRVDRRRFFRRRALRLWPVLWLYLAALLALGGTGAWRMVWPVLLHVQNYDDQAPSHLWSLAVEEHFYLGAVLMIPPLLRRGGYPLVERALLAVMAACLLLRLGALATGVPLLHLQWQTQYRLDAPAFGVLMASISLHQPALFARLARRRGWWFAAAVAGTVIMGVAGDGDFRHGPGFTIAYLAAGAFVMALVGTRIPRAVAWPAGRLAALGVIAYPVYVWHASIGVTVRAVGTQVPSPLLVVGAIAGAIVVGAAVHVLVERPAMRLRDRSHQRLAGSKAIANELQQYS